LHQVIAPSFGGLALISAHSSSYDALGEVEDAFFCELPHRVAGNCRCMVVQPASDGSALDSFDRTLEAVLANKHAQRPPSLVLTPVQLKRAISVRWRSPQSAISMSCPQSKAL